MGTIQLKRQLKFASTKNAAIKYIKQKLKMAPGEPLICTYKNENGKWGVMEIICVYSKDVIYPKNKYPFLEQQNLINDNGYISQNIIKINDDLEWENI